MGGFYPTPLLSYLFIAEKERSPLFGAPSEAWREAGRDHKNATSCSNVSVIRKECQLTPSELESRSSFGWGRSLTLDRADFSTKVIWSHQTNGGRLRGEGNK